MRHIIEFSLNRRFKNKITIFMHVMIIVILSILVFGDLVIDMIFEDSNQKIIIYYPEEEIETFKYANTDEDDFEFKKGYDKKHINILKEDIWIIESEYSLDAFVSLNIHSKLSEIITNNWFMTMNDESQNMIMQNISPEISERTLSETVVSRDKINMSMFMVTGIYFAMLSFCTMIANEVVYEKTSRVLELILTSVTTTTHYYSKMITAWITIIIQISTMILEASLVLLLRQLYDEGHGILKLLFKYGLIETNSETFSIFIKDLGIDSNIIIILLVSLVYMLLGMILIQMIMVCLSSFVNSIEESSSLQAPVYIILLAVYYLALALNSPSKLSAGLGYTLSLTPLFSMLFMPMRLLLMKVNIYEIILGVVLSVVTLITFSYYGSKIYKIGILGGTNFRRKINEKKLRKLHNN